MSAIFRVVCVVGSFFPGATVSGGSYCIGAYSCFDFVYCVWPQGGKSLVPGFVVGGSCFSFFIGGAVVGVGLVVRRRGCSIVELLPSASLEVESGIEQAGCQAAVRWLGAGESTHQQGVQAFASCFQPPSTLQASLLCQYKLVGWSAA